MAITQYYVDPAIAGDSGTGTIGDPYGDLQFALNTITRNATDGDQICIKAGTAEVLAAALTLATYGTPTENAPLILRGYTSAANDYGVGEINCNGTQFFATTQGFAYLIDLKIHTFGDNNGVSAGYVLRCEVHNATSTSTNKCLVSFDVAAGCYIHDSGSGVDARGLSGTYAYGNYIANCNVGIYLGENCVSQGNIIIVPSGGIGVNSNGDRIRVVQNIVASLVANTGLGIELSNIGGTRTSAVCLNNIIAGFSGAGGRGAQATNNVFMLGFNALYNNTTNYSLSMRVVSDLRAFDVALAADPFTDAANGDFSLTAAAKAALRSLGWPASYLGAHANSDPHITIGAVQYGAAEAGGGAVSISPFRGNVG